MMDTERLQKHWKIVEVQLAQAAAFLDEPHRFAIPERELAHYRDYIDNNEFGLAMEEIAEIAKEFGCKSGFWRRLKKAADQMGLAEKSDEYERLFHEALEKKA